MQDFFIKIEFINNLMTHMKEKRQKLKEVTNKNKNHDLEIEKGTVIENEELMIYNNVVDTDEDSYFYSDLQIEINYDGFEE